MSDPPALEPMNPDAEAVYDGQIAPLVDRIIAICKAHRIPVLAVFQYQDGAREDGAAFCTTFVPFAGASPVLRAALSAIRGGASLFAYRVTESPLPPPPEPT